MNRPTPRVSIGMPVFNGENYISKALESVLDQTFDDLEIVISDNDSQDATEEICRDFAARDPRIQYHRQISNIGAIGNFNRVFELSNGEYFKWAAHDDVCQSDFLKECVEILDTHPNVAWCHCKSDMIDANGNSWLTQLPEDADELERQPDGSLWWKGLPRTDHDADQPHRRFAGVLLGTNWCVDSYGLIRASALRKTRLLVPLYGCEKVLMGELSLLGKYRESPRMLFSQRIHSQASSSLTSVEAQEEFAAKRFAKPFFSTRFSLLKAHLGAIHHSDLSFLDKIRCDWVVARYVLQINKWSSVLKSMLSGKGVGGAGKRMMSKRTAEASVDE